VIDLHCHVLAGIDDGPGTMDGSIALARVAASAGTRTLVATPHVSSRYPNDPATIARLTETLNARLREEAIPLEVLRGAEVAMMRAVELDAAELSRLGLGGGPWLLAEPPLTQPAERIESAARTLMDAGHRLLIAHPERCMAFHRDPLLLEALVRGGALTSITAGSLSGRFGGHVRRFALELARRGLVHNVASDAHDHSGRPPRIAEELQRAGLGPLEEWLTCSVPDAILRGEEVPPPPADVKPSIPRARSSWWQRVARRPA
jgi:protein-tyrosine phosphatase